MVRSDGSIRLHGKFRFIGEALHKMALGLRGRREEGYEVYFADRLLGFLDANNSGMLQATPSASQRLEDSEKNGSFDEKKV